MYKYVNNEELRFGCFITAPVIVILVTYTDRGRGRGAGGVRRGR